MEKIPMGRPIYIPDNRYMEITSYRRKSRLGKGGLKNGFQPIFLGL